MCKFRCLAVASIVSLSNGRGLWPWDCDWDWNWTCPEGGEGEAWRFKGAKGFYVRPNRGLFALLAAQNEEQPLVLVLWPCVRLEPSGGYIKNDLLYGGSPFMTSRKLHFMSHLFSAHRLQFLFLVYLLIKIEDDVRQLHTEMANYASCLQLQCTDRQILASSSSSVSPTTATNTTLTHTLTRTHTHRHTLSRTLHTMATLSTFSSAHAYFN